jgi:hypothetical protein
MCYLESRTISHLRSIQVARRDAGVSKTGKAMSRTRSWLWASVLVGCGMLLHLPSLGWGFLWDDFIHQAVFRYGDAIPEVSPLNLYDYGVRPQPGAALGKLGLYPWWTSEDFRVRFFRPVASLSLLSDYLMYRGWAPGYHLTNILLFGVLLSLSYLLYRRLGASPAAALWALAFLALDDIHVVPVGWIANRNTVLANLFIVATLLSVDWHCRTRSRWALAGAVASFLLACGAKETALITVGLVGLYVWLLDRLPGNETLIRSFRRVLGFGVMWVFVAATALYVAGYVLTGHGTNSALYSTPWHSWGAFVSRLATFVPLAGASLFFGVSTDLVFMKPSWASPLAWAMFPLLGLLAWFTWRRLRTQRLAGYAAGWMLIALAPAAGVTTSDRLLMDATLGSALLLGLLIASLRSGSDIPGPYRVGRYALVGLLLCCGPVMSLPMTWIRGNWFYDMAATDRDVIARAEIPREKHGARHVFLLNPPSTVLALTILPTWTVLHDDPGVSFYSLQMARRPWGWRRDGERTVVMSYGPPALLAHRYERLFRSTVTPPAVGTVFETAALKATVLEIDAEGIRRVRLELPHDLDDPSYHFLLWEDGRLRKTSPPPIGETAHYEAAKPVRAFAP